jgi:hypothetical protein
MWIDGYVLVASNSLLQSRFFAGLHRVQSAAVDEWIEAFHSVSNRWLHVVMWCIWSGLMFLHCHGRLNVPCTFVSIRMDSVCDECDHVLVVSNVMSSDIVISAVPYVRTATQAWWSCEILFLRGTYGARKWQLFARPSIECGKDMMHGFICGIHKSVLDSYTRSWQLDVASPEQLVCHLGLWGATGAWRRHVANMEK